jgi:NitT/TauT family transport system substrate-binding protein
MAFQQVLRSGGIDPLSITYLQNFDADEAGELFQLGIADFLLTSIAEAARIARSGAVLVLDLAATLGPVPWSVYYATPRFLDDDRNLAGRFTRAIDRALAWIHGHEADEIVDLLAPRFAHEQRRHTIELVGHLSRHGLWPETSEIGSFALERWCEAMRAYGLLRGGASPTVVDNRPGQWARRG